MIRMDVSNMQAKYPNKQSIRAWDTVNQVYPTRKFPETDETSSFTGLDWIGQPEVLKDSSDPLTQIKQIYRDYNVERDLMRSRFTVDFGFKHPETKRHNKHTSCTENRYIYPPSRRLADRPPQCRVHGTTEMKSAYKQPEVPARLCTAKEQFMHPASLPLDPPHMEPRWHKELEPLDTTHEGFEKYLDPYLTTSRLHHRPYTADQLQRESNSAAKNIVTYYTFSDTPMTRTPKSKPAEWQLPLPRPKSTYDREKFKEGFREIRTHNKLNCVPGAFRTEVRDNFTSFMAKPEYRIHNYERDVASYYKRAVANLSTNTESESDAFLQGYSTENATIGSKKPLCAVIDQYPERNKKLVLRESKSCRK